MDCKKAAEKIFKAIKEEVSATRKYNKENSYKREISIEFTWNSRNNSTWNGKEWTKGTTTYEIYDGHSKPLIEGISFFSEMNTIFANLRTLLDAQKKVKGWSTLVYSTEKVEEFTNSFYNRPTMAMITKVEMPDAPCKEYKSLMNYLNKYGVRMENNGRNWTYSMNLGNFQLYSVYAGGKRGVLWGEEGTRRYLDNKPKKCADILATIRKHRTAKDKLICIFGKEEYIEPLDRQYSIYHETECDGEIRSYVNIIVKSDKGKTKCDIKVY